MLAGKDAEAAEDLVNHYQATGSRDLSDSGYLFAHLAGFFRTKRIAEISPADIPRYITRRQGEGAANGTIGRELGNLSRMLRLEVRLWAMVSVIASYSSATSVIGPEVTGSGGASSSTSGQPSSSVAGSSRSSSSAGAARSAPRASGEAG